MIIMKKNKKRQKQLQKYDGVDSSDEGFSVDDTPVKDTSKKYVRTNYKWMVSEYKEFLHLMLPPEVSRKS